MRVQPVAELSVRNRQWLPLDNVFGNLAQRQRHCGEDEEAGDKRQTKKTFRVVVIFHVRQDRRSCLSFFPMMQS